MKCWKYISMTQPIGVAPRKFIFMVFRGLGHFPNKLKMHFCVHKCTACQVAKLGMKERIRQWKI